MRPTGYDQRQIDLEYSKDRLREAEMARLALEARGEPVQRARSTSTHAAQLAHVLRQAFSRVAHQLSARWRYLRRQWRQLRHGVAQRPRHT